MIRFLTELIRFTSYNFVISKHYFGSFPDLDMAQIHELFTKFFSIRPVFRFCRRPLSKISLPTILEILCNFDFKTFAGSDHRSFLNNSSRPEKLWPDTNQGHKSLFLISKICFKNQKCVWRSKVHLSSFMRVLLQKGLEVNTTEHFPITHLFIRCRFWYSTVAPLRH